MFVVYLFLVIFTFSCSSTGKLSVKTNPGTATIKLADDSGEIRELGNTPISANFNEVFANSKNIKVIIEKKNFESEKIIISRPQIATDFNISVDLKRDSSAETHAQTLENLEKVARGVAEAIKKIQQKRFKDAENQLLRFIDNYPSVSVGYDLLGNVYYMLGDKVAARAQYLKAESISPNNFERKRLIQQLENNR